MFPYDAKNTYKISSSERVIKFQQGKAPVNVFESLYKQSLDSKLIKTKIKLAGYKLTEKDIKEGFYTLEKNQEY